MADRPLRIAWLVRHRALRDGEVPVLRRLGFEVYTPKSFGTDIESSNGAAFPEDDRALTLPPADLGVLNRTDFCRGAWPARAVAALNRNFDAIACAVLPGLVREALRRFDGLILLRAFGREGALRHSDRLGLDLLRRIEEIRDRVRFAPLFDDIRRIEGPLLRDLSCHLPAALPARHFEEPETWTGEDRRLLFLCPDIAQSPGSGKAYREFKSWFGDMPHAIAGAQSKPVEDPRVLGFLPEGDYRRLLQGAAAMFCPGTDPRRTRFYPLEAAARGLPLVHLKGGWLGRLHDGPGACASMGEARDLVRRLLDGDRDLAERLRRSQRALLEPFRPAAVEAAFRERLLPLLEARGRPQPAGAASGRPAPGARRVGLWLQIRPDQGQRGQGIASLMSAWLRGMVQNGVRPVIALPVWALARTREFLAEQGLDDSSVEFLPSRRFPPPFQRLLERLRSGFIRPAWRWLRGLSWAARAAAAGARAAAVRIGGRLIGFSWTSWALLLLLFGGLLGALGRRWPDETLRAARMAGIALPALALAILAVLGAALAAGWIARRLLKPLAARLSRLWTANRFVLYRWALTRFGLDAYLEAMDLESRRLVRRANRRTDIPGWIAVNPSFDGATRLKAPLLMCVPDLVYLDHPSSYNTDWYGEVDRRCRRLAERADAFAAYSEDVARRHVGRLDPDGRPVRIIRHAPMDAYRALYDGDPDERDAAAEAARGALDRAADRLQDPSRAEWLRRLPIGDIPFLFVSSQNRPHKNLLGMARAFEILLRRHRVSLKLLTTGVLEQTPACGEFIRERALRNDVLSLHDLSPAEHAAVYRLAALTIVPTLFEGGFPFVFAESVSVGTPVLLSDIACVREELPTGDVPSMTFDPRDPEAIAAAILGALPRRAALLARQRAILEEQRRRTWADVARELVDAIPLQRAGTEP